MENPTKKRKRSFRHCFFAKPDKTTESKENPEERRISKKVHEFNYSKNHSFKQITI
jgi:hypothetical protein